MIALVVRTSSPKTHSFFETLDKVKKQKKFSAFNKLLNYIILLSAKRLFKMPFHIR